MNELATLEPNDHLPRWDIVGSDELEPQQRDRVNAFRDALQECYAQGGVKVLDVAEMEHVVTDPAKPQNLQLSNHIEKKVISTSGALFVSPEYAWLQNAGLTKFNVLRSARAETSAHQVYFGILHDGDPEKKALGIAVKPCVENRITACNDWLNAVLAHRNGERSFRPIGFMVYDNVGYSITELDVGPDTLDNTSWQNVLIDEGNPRYQGQIQTLGEIATGLARLHRGVEVEPDSERRVRIAHGDPQFKNIALDVTGELFFIDWESADFFGEDPKVSDVVHKIERDLKVLFSSMARSEEKKGVGLLDIFLHPVQWQLFKKHIFDPYMEAYLADSTSEGQDFEIIAEVEERLEQYVLEGQLYGNLGRERHQ